MGRRDIRLLAHAKMALPELPGFANPLDFIAEDHLAEREICALIDSVAASDVPDAQTCERIITFLKYQLPAHLEDEERDLFPMLRRRCDAEDEIDKALDKLENDHEHAADDTPAVIALLAGQAIDAAGRTRLTDYARNARRHLIFENAIILPLARLRLRTSDLNRMRANMLKRRGLDRLLGAPC
ncbi:hemerythrin domain-containing protein [Octadecabacter sp. R77987]|uniref:hemerythrin domain-containing protein n=1 Tax=Octadecabacter sp. R77987 TaxID=3093874 RepID=UPI0036700992